MPMKADGALDKARKHKKRQLEEDTRSLVIKKRKEYEDKMKEKGETPVMFSHLGPVRRRTTAEEEERAKYPTHENSVYYHPTLNPSGAPPPGKPQTFKSSVAPRIPLTEGSAGDVASSSKSEAENAAGFDLSLPPPPPSFPSAGLEAGDGSIVSQSLPLPPPPPMPLKPALMDNSLSLPPSPPPPGPPPKELLATRSAIPLPPPILQSSPPPPPGINGSEKPAKSDVSAIVDSIQDDKHFGGDAEKVPQSQVWLQTHCKVLPDGAQRWTTPWVRQVYLKFLEMCVRDRGPNPKDWDGIIFPQWLEASGYENKGFVRCFSTTMDPEIVGFDGIQKYHVRTSNEAIQHATATIVQLQAQIAAHAQIAAQIAAHAKQIADHNKKMEEVRVGNNRIYADIYARAGWDLPADFGGSQGNTETQKATQTQEPTPTHYPSGGVYGFVPGFSTMVDPEIVGFDGIRKYHEHVNTGASKKTIQHATALIVQLELQNAAQQAQIDAQIAELNKKIEEEPARNNRILADIYAKAGWGLPPAY